MLKLGRMHRQTGERFGGPYCNVKTNESGLRLLEFATFLQPSTDKHPWPSQTIQKIDMAQPRWESPQPD